MKLVVTHEQPDFDALASVALAKLAHPGAVGTLTGAINPRLRDAIGLYRDELNLQDATQIDQASVQELIVVDTNDASRLGPFSGLADMVPVTLYDHHGPADNPIPATQGVQDQVGATATILTRHLQASNTPIPPSIATLALLGIHEDTGNLTYPGTRADDHAAAAHLLRSGANLELVMQLTHDPLSPEQRGLLGQLLESATLEPDGERHILVASRDLPDFVPGISGIVSQLLSLHACDAAIVAIGQPDHTLMFARVARAYDAAAAFKDAFGSGGGHPSAAFARTQTPMQEALELALEKLRQNRRETTTARQLMSSPVITIPDTDTVSSALQNLRRHGHGGAPVTDPGGQVTGIVSSRDLEHALRFDMGDASVTGFMNRGVITAGPDESLVQLESRLIQHAIGRLPVIGTDGRLLGIVTRSDLIRARHERIAPDSAQSVIDRLPALARRVVEQAAALLPAGAHLYLVGGMVRDALLGRSFSDLDLAVEGTTAQSLAAALAREHGGYTTPHEAFGTTTYTTPAGLSVDLAGTRFETYAHPGALPDVSPGSITRDLQRRDYTVNAIAVRVHPEPKEVIDPTGGVNDLQRGVLRLLHALSFAEDPTRLIRGARLAARLGFQFGNGTLRQARLAMLPNVLSRVSPARFRNELVLALGEPRVAPVTAVLDHTGALERIYHLQDAPELLAMLDASADDAEAKPEAALLALLMQTPAEDAEKHMAQFSWPQKHRAALDRLQRSREDPDALSEELLGRMTPAELQLARTFGDRQRELVDAFRALPERRRLRGSDVLSLGVREGPAIGRILGAVANARQAGQVDGFEAELRLARELVAQTPTE